MAADLKVRKDLPYSTSQCNLTLNPQISCNFCGSQLLPYLWALLQPAARGRFGAFFMSPTVWEGLYRALYRFDRKPSFSPRWCVHASDVTRRGRSRLPRLYLLVFLSSFSYVSRSSLKRRRNGKKTTQTINNNCWLLWCYERFPVWSSSRECIGVVTRLSLKVCVFVVSSGK